MNDPRTIFEFDSMAVESFPVNDERALRSEVEALELAWENWPGDERTAMVSLVRDALLRLAEDVEAWLPAAVVAETNTSFGFFVWWRNRHMDEEIVRQRVSAERDDRERLRDLERIAGKRDQNHP
jgi:hypothetical protein